MIKLIRSLLRHKFWSISLYVCLVMSAICGVLYSCGNSALAYLIPELEILILLSPLFSHLIAAFFVSSVLEQEFKGSAVNNKIISGNKKASVYIAEMTVLIVVQQAMFLSFLLGAARSLITISDIFDPATILLTVLALYSSHLLVCVITAALTLMIGKKTVVLAICAVYLLTSFMATNKIENDLVIEKYVTETVIHSNGKEETLTRVHSSYCGGIARIVFVALTKASPYNHRIKLAEAFNTQRVFDGGKLPIVSYRLVYNTSVKANPYHSFGGIPIVSILMDDVSVIAIHTVIGYLVFRRKSFK